MTKVSDIFQVIDAAAPFSSCESFDNVGVLIRTGGQPLPGYA